MNSRRAYESGVHRYLREAGVLGQPKEVIAAAKREYWNKRKLELKKERLKKEKEFAVLLAPAEQRLIAEAAKLHGMSRTRFIKQAALAYVRKRYLVPGNGVLREVLALLEVNYSALQALADRHLVPEETGTQLLAKMDRLEREIRQVFIEPKAERHDH